MNPAIPAAAAHAALKARIEDYKHSAEDRAGVSQRNALDRAHFEGRAWAFGKVLEWLKEDHH